MAFLEFRPTTPLYHYCGAGGFDGITDRREIWLSDLQHANDPKELQLAEIADRALADLIENESDRPEWRVAYEQISVALKRLRSSFGMYSFSLSLQADKLPMWQEYTDRGRGYCIAFRPTAFNHMTLRVQKVTYEDPDRLKSIHDEIKSIAAPLVGHPYDFLQQVEPVTNLLCRITAVKEDSWRHENEVRLIFSSMAKPSDFERGASFQVGMFGEGKFPYPADPLLRERDGVQVPYFSKPFGRLRGGHWDASRAVQLVIIGPNNPRTVDEVATSLRIKGYQGFDVVKSRCAFRP
jgi:hypothetical protein